MSRRLREDSSVWMYEDEDREDDTFTEEDMQNALAQLLSPWDDYGTDINCEVLKVRTFADAGVMTYNKGLVITLPDGSEYQLTIVQSR